MVAAEEKAKAAAEEKAKADATAAKKDDREMTEYVSKGNLMHRIFGKEEKIFEGESIPKKTLSVMIGIDKDTTLLQHWIDRGLVMLKKDYDAIKAKEKADAEAKAKAAIRR
jgi:hypothetical protein